MKTTNLATTKSTNSNIISLADRKQRDTYACKVEILNKVKPLPMLPNSEYTVIEAIADYFNITISALRTTVCINKEELLSDGMTYVRKNYFVDRYKKQIININHGVVAYQFNNIPEFKVSGSGRQVFTKKSVMRLAMLLKTSRVAAEIRNVLLGKSVRKAKADLEEATADVVQNQNPETKVIERYKKQYRAVKAENAMLRREVYKMKDKYDELDEKLLELMERRCLNVG